MLTLYFYIQLLANIALQTTSTSHRSINQGSVLRIQVPGSEKGYLIAALYGIKQGLLQVMEDGIPGNWQNGQADPQDGIVEIKLYHENFVGAPRILFPKGTYFLKVEAADSPSAAVPQFWNIQFDIV